LHYRENGVVGQSDDPALGAEGIEAAKRSELEFADGQAAKARSELRESIAKAREILASPRLTSIMNIRDKHLAHSLERMPW
jgi:hypothetical protein